MNIDRSEALLIYTFIFTHINSEKTEEMFDEESYRSLRNFQEELSHFLVGNDVNCNVHDVVEDDHCETCEVCDEDTESDESDETDEDEDEDASDETEDENNNVEEPDTDDFLTTELLNDLSSVLVTSPTGSKITLEFEDIDEDDMVDVLLDEGSVIIESVTRLKLHGKTIEIFDGHEWHSFLIEKKLPKSWSKKVKNDVMYGFKRNEKDE